MKIANIFLMVRDKHVVTIKHLREVDVGLSDSVKNLTRVTLTASFQGHVSENRAWRLNRCS